MKTRFSKFMSLLVSLVMLISMITVVNVHAAEFGGLTVVKGTATLETAKAYDGVNSVLLDATSGTTDLGKHAEIKVVDGQKYNVEMYIYPVSAAGTGNMWIHLHGGSSGVQKAYITNPETGLKSNGSIWKTEQITTPGKEGWWRLYTSSAIEATGTWQADFFVAESGFKCYVDKITITPENSTTPVFFTNFEPMKHVISEIEEGKITELYNTQSVDSKVGYATDETGNRFLKIDAKANGGVWVGDPVEDFKMEAHSGDTKPGYGIEFDVYVDSWTSGKLWLMPAPNNNSYYPTVYWANLNYSAEKGLYVEDTNARRWKVEAIDGTGWYKVRNLTPITSEKGFASSGDKNCGKPGYMWFVDARSNEFSVCIDNIKLYNWTEVSKTENSGNIVGDPIKVIDFENHIDYAARVDYMPKNFMAVHVAETKMSVSWRNPVAPAISSVKLYNVTDPKAVTEITPTTAFSTGADALNEYVHDGVSGENAYVYRLEYTFADGTVKSYIAGCTARGAGYSIQAGSWNLGSAVNATTGKKHTAKINVDDRTYRTSAPSMHFVSNQTQKVNEGGNSFLKLSLPDGVKYDTTKVYKIKGYYKKNNAGYVYDRVLSSTVNDTYRMYKICGQWGQFKTNDWDVFEVTKTPDSETGLALNFTFVHSVEDLWLDDIEIYELVGDETSAINEEKGNLLASNGAVNDVSARPNDVSNVVAEPAAFGAKLSWTAGADAEYVAVYDKDVTEYTPVAYVPASLGEVTIANLEDGETYNYIVKTVNAEGRESENGVEASVMAGGEEFIETYYVPAKNFIVTQVSGTQISVSWRNPKTTEGSISAITKAEVYDADTNELIYAGTDMTANAISEYLDTAFTAGTAKNYRLDLTYSDGAVKSQVVGIVPASAGYLVQAGSWKFHSGQNPKPAASFEIDDKVYKTAAPSIRIASNKTVFGSGALLELIVPTVNLEVGKTYRVSAYTKKNNTRYIWGTVGGVDSNRIFPTTGGTYNTNVWTADWEYIKNIDDITVTSETAISTIVKFDFQCYSEDVWIDDVAIHEVVDGNVTGDNLLAGIGTCDDVSAAPAELTGVTAVAKENEIMVKWGTTDAAFVAVYDKATSVDIPVAYVPASMGYVDLKNVTAGKAYNYIVKAVNAEGRESANGVAASATPLATALVISDYNTSVSGNEVTVSVDLKNNSYGNGLTAQLFLAVYDGKVLESINASEITSIPQTDLGEDAIPVSAKITVPEGKTMVMYLWNSLDGMKPLKECQEYSAN